MLALDGDDAAAIWLAACQMDLPDGWPRFSPRDFAVPLRTRAIFDDGKLREYDVYAVDTNERIGLIYTTGRKRWSYIHRHRRSAEPTCADGEARLTARLREQIIEGPHFVKFTRMEALWTITADEHEYRAQLDLADVEWDGAESNRSH
jgi:hypothetical protein